MPQIYNNDSHRTVVSKIADNISRHNPDKYKIILGESNQSIPGLSEICPDIALLTPDGSSLLLAIQVETQDSITESSAIKRWLPVINAGKSLDVFVPKGRANSGKTIARKLKIKPKLVEY